MAFTPQSDGDDMVENHDINVTPLVDVMLVLLIIVMVAAPLATVNIPVDLPSANLEPEPQPKDPIYLTVQADRSLTLGEETSVTLDELQFAIAAVAKEDNPRIHLRADKTLSYENLMTVMNALIAAGYSQIALVGLEASTEPTH